MQALQGGSMAFKRVLNKGVFVVMALTALLFVAGIIILPSLGPTYADEHQTQSESLEKYAPPAVAPMSKP